MTKPDAKRPMGWRGWTLAILLTLAAGGLGRWKGAADAREAFAAAPQDDLHLPGPPPRSPEDTARNAATAPLSKPACAAIRKRVLFLAQHVSYAQDDWDWRAETQSLLAQLPADELAAVFSGLNQYWHTNDTELAQEILHYWILKDPSAALTAAVLATSDTTMSQEAFNAWGREHPAEALAWAEAKETLGNQKLEAARASFGHDFVSGLLMLNPDLAVQHFRSMDATEATRTLTGWGYRYGGDPAQRERLLSLAGETGRKEDRDALSVALMNSWGKADPGGAREYLNGLDLPSSQRLEMDASLTLAGMAGDPQAALKSWMQRNGDKDTAPGPISQILSGWIVEDSSTALKWLADQPPGAQVDQMAMGSLQMLGGAKRFEDATKVVGSISDPGTKSKAIELLSLSWSRADPAGAEKWGASLPAADAR